MTEFIKAVATIMWPVCTFFTIWYFRIELKDILKRLKKGKAFGAEVEFNEAIIQLNNTVDVIATASSFKTHPAPDHSTIVDSDTLPSTNPRESLLMPDFNKTPKASLLFVESEIERQVIYIAASTGLFEPRITVNMQDLLQKLSSKNIFSNHVMTAISTFFGISAKVLRESNPSEIQNIHDTGLKILLFLKEIPYTIQTVQNPSVKLFSDQDCKNIRNDMIGVWIEYKNDATEKKQYGLFPTTRNYQRGQQVTIEFNTNLSVDKTWYKHPDTGKTTLAWLGHAEFVGRDIESLLSLA